MRKPVIEVKKEILTKEELCLSNVAQFPLQKIFDFIAISIIDQGMPAYDGQSCVYRTPGGLKCAVGMIMTDEEAEVAPIVTVRGVLQDLKIPVPPKYSKFLDEVQQAHDHPAGNYGGMNSREFILAFVSGMEFVGRAFGLDVIEMRRHATGRLADLKVAEVREANAAKAAGDLEAGVFEVPGAGYVKLQRQSSGGISLKSCDEYGGEATVCPNILFINEEGITIAASYAGGLPKEGQSDNIPESQLSPAFGYVNVSWS